MSSLSLDRQVFKLDYDREIEKISTALRAYNRKHRRRGAIIALSGGIDSSVCAALCVEAFGADKVQALLLPEQDSSRTSSSLGELIAEHLKLDYIVTDLSPTLDAIGCYRWRDEAIRTVFPAYQKNWRNKIVISGGAKGGFHYFRLIVQTPEGELLEKRLPYKAYLQIVAATNFKQRIRKTIEYFHADRLNFSVIGTPNRVEYDQGFFVKNGDGSADIKPIAHLYKSQVYALARHMGLPEAICTAIPTTDTYSLPQGQDEFYYALPYEKMDLALWAKNNGIPAAKLGKTLDISIQQAELIYADIEAKRNTTTYLHAPPALVETVVEV